MSKLQDALDNHAHMYARGRRNPLVDPLAEAAWWVVEPNYEAAEKVLLTGREQADGYSALRVRAIVDAALGITEDTERT